MAGRFGFVAPIASSDAAVEALHAKLSVILRSLVIQARLHEIGVVTCDKSSGAFSALIKAEQVKFAGLLKALDIKP